VGFRGVSRAAQDNQSFPVIASPVALWIFYEASNTTRIQEGYDWLIGSVKKEKLTGWVAYSSVLLA
jgi:hypothetical protein